MHTNLFEIARKHKQLLVALLGIACVLCTPIPTPTTRMEENPDDAYAVRVSKKNPLSIHLENIPKATSAITLFANDSIKTPPETTVHLQIDGSEQQSLPFKKLLSGERQMNIPLPRRDTTELDISLATPTLDEKKALILRTSQDNKTIIAYTLYENKSFISALVQALYARDSTSDDIEYVWKEGAGMLQRGNPYEKAANAAHWENKYATYFPLSYIVSAAIQKLGASSFSSWLAVVRPIVLGSQLATALLVLVFLYTQKKLALGIFSFFLILFHRFVLYPAQTAQVDFPAIFFLLLGIILLNRKPKTGYVLIGVSLAIKQMAIILLPIFLIWEFSQRKSKKQTLHALVLMLVIPALTLLPFFIDSPAGVRNSLAFSANRFHGGDFTTLDISTLLSIEGPASRLGMYALIGIIVIAFWRKEIGIWGACLAIFTVFIGFNPVLFYHYLAWIIPLIPPALAERKLQEPTFK